MLREAQLLVGEGEVRLEVVSAPVVEWVYVGLENDQVVISDKGATFAEIAGVHGDTDEYVEWSAERAGVPARTFGVSLVEEADRNERGEVLAEGWRLRRAVAPGESVGNAIQSMAHAIDGVLAVHARTDPLTKGSYFWDHHSDALDE